MITVSLLQTEDFYATWHSAAANKNTSLFFFHVEVIKMVFVDKWIQVLHQDLVIPG